MASFPSGYECEPTISSEIDRVAESVPSSVERRYDEIQFNSLIGHVTREVGDLSYCTCKRCCDETLSHPRERFCCKESEIFSDSFLCRKNECCGRSTKFQTLCLDKDVLAMAIDNYDRAMGKRFCVNKTNEQYRFAAYRNFTYKIWGHPGQNKRIPIPACCITEIRKAYPANDGAYKPFLPLKQNYELI